MTREFTKREKALLLILVCILLGAVYYFLVALPSMNRISAAQEQTALLQDEMMVETARLKQIQEMQQKIEDASLRNGFKTEIPAYDNLENVMKQLDTILSSTTDYALAFSPITEEGSLVYRPIEVQFHCANYGVARGIIDKIYTSPFKSMIDTLSVDNVEYNDADIANSPVEITMTVIFIEKKAA